MSDAVDIWELAAELMKQFDVDAALLAALRADAYFNQGDNDAYRYWYRVVKAINEIEKPRANA